MAEAPRDPEPPQAERGAQDRRTWTHGAAFGWLAGALFFCVAGLILFMGTILGDCFDGACHANDGYILRRGFGFIALAAAALGFCVRIAVSLAWPWLAKEAGPGGAGCVALAAAILIGALAGGHWIYVMIALGV